MKNFPFVLRFTALLAAFVWVLGGTACNKKDDTPKDGAQATVGAETEQNTDTDMNPVGEDTGTATKIGDGPDPSNVPSSQAVLGQPLPAIRLEDADGNTVQLRDLFFGKVGVVVFVGPACPPCIEELKKLDTFLTENNLPVNVVVVARSLSGGRPILNEAGVDYPLYLDSFNEGPMKMGVNQKGTFFLIDNQGRLQTTGQIMVDEPIPGAGTFLEIVAGAIKGKYPDRSVWDPDPWKKWAAGEVDKRAQAPDFTLQALDGRSFTLSETLEKKNVLLVFFNRRCPHCIKEMPEIQKYYDKNKDAYNFEVLALTPSPGDEEDASVRQYARDYSLTFPILTIRQDNADLFDQFGVQSIPAWGVIGPDRKFHVARTGEHPDIGSVLTPAFKELQ